MGTNENSEYIFTVAMMNVEDIVKDAVDYFSNDLFAKDDDVLKLAERMKGLSDEEFYALAGHPKIRAEIVENYEQGTGRFSSLSYKNVANVVDLILTKRSFPHQRL